MDWWKSEFAEALAPEARRDRVSHHVPSNLATPSDPDSITDRISLAYLPLVRSRLLHSTGQGSWRTHWLYPSLLRRGFRKGICGRLQGYRQDPNENTRGRNKRKDNYYQTNRSRAKTPRLAGSHQDHGKGRETNRP